MIPGAAHVDFLEFAGDEYRQRILVFLARALVQRTKTQGQERTKKTGSKRVKDESGHALTRSESRRPFLDSGST
jgi:hypothetical protein